MSKKIKLVQRLETIKALCKGKKVLHLGCTNYPYTQDAIDNDMLLHFDLEREASSIYGFDFDQAGIDILESHGSKNLFQADLEHLEDVGLDETFDVIIAGEMIEHLNNQGLFLSGIKRFMGPGTQLVMTTINAYCGMRFFVYGLRGKGGYLGTGASGSHRILFVFDAIVAFEAARVFCGRISCSTTLAPNTALIIENSTI